MLQVHQVSKSYGQLQVLKGVDLEVQSGELVAIVGASGAGKSTLLHIIGSLDAPDGGQVLVNGLDISALSGKKLAQFRNQEIGFVFQFHHLLPEFSALENVLIPALIAGPADAATTQRAKDLLQDLGLGNRLEHKPNELSGGEQQRVAVARALINQPALVLADEPTGNLDSERADELHHLFLRLREKYGLTFIIVTHNEDLAAMADRQVVMKDGEIISA